MMNSTFSDIIVIGGGIVGAATAMKLSRGGKYSVRLLEAEPKLAAHQTGNNSGVIHSGLYYKPGSLKAENCARGREMMYQFCQENDLPVDRCGKLVVAVEKDELPAMEELERRGIANGLAGIKRLSKDELKEYEPHVNGLQGLYVPQTGIVDYVKVTEKYASLLTKAGGEVIKSCRVFKILEKENIIVGTTLGDYECRLLINCGGLQSDRIAKLAGIYPDVTIVPFRGEYYNLKKEKQYLVNNLVYPVPDPRFPFLGVHFTRMIDGGREAGPNAVLAYKREGYSHIDISLTDMLELLAWQGFWKMAAKYYKMGFSELYRSFSKNAFVKSLQRLIPEITENDVEPGGAGVRAQALDKHGKLLDDFCVVEARRMIHVLNAPSPAATASLSIGEYIADLAEKRL